jgi:quercetin dioxygenase-like cupin family protein
MSSADTVQVLDVAGPELPLVEGEGRAQAVVWPGVGAQLRSMHVISLGAGSRTVDQRHAGEAVYYAIEGSGQVWDPTEGERQPLVTGSMVHVEPGTAYAIEAGADGLKLVGGPSPVDLSLYPGEAS